MLDWSWKIDGAIVLAGALCAGAAALLGNFLVLRRMSLIGDAISHAVLPGLAAAFLFSGERQGFGMFFGAATVGVLTVFLTEFAKQYGRVDESASIGIVFTFLFAIGLLMITQAAEKVDLDPGCVLYGVLETSYLDTVAVFGMQIPRVIVTLAFVFALNLAFVVLMYRQLKVSTFDPQLAISQGVPVGVLHYVLAAFVAVTAVASFESVGNILVVAMFVVPPVAAWQLTDRLPIMILLSVLIGWLSAIAGHLGAITLPKWFGYETSTNTAGMMAVAAGAFLFIIVLFAPRKGILSRAWMSFRVAIRILSDDVLASMFRAEKSGKTQISIDSICDRLLISRIRARVVVWWIRFRKQVTLSGEHLALTDVGRVHAQNIVRAHRLWEQYLASEAGFPSEALHEGAEKLEHFTDRKLRERLLAETNQPELDPHGSPIPPEADARPTSEN